MTRYLEWLLPTQQCGQRPHVLLHQGVDLLFREAPDAVAVHLPAHHAAVQVTQQPLQSVAQRAAHGQQLLSFLQVVHPLTVGYCPERTHTADNIVLAVGSSAAGQDQVRHQKSNTSEAKKLMQKQRLKTKLHCVFRSGCSFCHY